jgi:hypothetical protein
MNDRNQDGLGASARPGDMRRAQRVVLRGLGQLVDDAEALERALALVGLLSSARLYCTRT